MLPLSTEVTVFFYAPRTGGVHRKYLIKKVTAAASNEDRAKCNGNSTGSVLTS